MASSRSEEDLEEAMMEIWQKLVSQQKIYSVLRKLAYLHRILLFELEHNSLGHECIYINISLVFWVPNEFIIEETETCQTL